MEKKKQDFFIDHLTEQLRKLQERRATYDAQFAVQQRETQAAIATLQDAATEMEAIQFEKRQLLNQWKSSLIGLRKRDEMVTEIESAITKQKESISIMNTEIAGYKRTIRKAQEEGENLTSVLNKLEYELVFIKKNIATKGDEKDKLSDMYSVFSKTLNVTENETTGITQEHTAVQAEVNAVQKASAQITLVIQSLEREIAEKLKTLSSYHKGAQSSQRDGNKLRALIHEKEGTALNYRNEISVIELENLNAESRCHEMNEQLKRTDKEITTKNELIEKYELEIRKNNDLLTKRASEMDLLNKKLDQLMSNGVDTNMGPLEATIYNLSKSIQLKESECLQLQQYWLRAQNEMVAMSKKGVEHTDEIQNLRMRLTVLNRKKMVVNNAFETEERQIKVHQRNIRQLQTEMIKVNTILSKQSSIYEKIEESNLEMEQKFRNKLKEAELESIELDTRLDKLKDEKEEALQGLIESERQLMLWEKKIQLAKETQSALDPNVGATEIREMSLEIHRMTLRYASMLKLQEKMIQEMERSIYRRESISSKGKAKGKGAGQLSLQKQIIDLTKKTQQAVKDIQDCDQDIIDLQQSHQIMKEQITESAHSSEKLEEKSGELDVQLESLTAKKRMYTNSILVFQKLQKRYQEYVGQKYQYVQPDLELRSQDLEKSRERKEKIKTLLVLLQDQVSSKLKSVLDQNSWFIDSTMSELDALCK